MLTVTPVPVLQFFDDQGAPLAGGLLYSYLSGTSTPHATYSDAAGTPNANPLVLDAAGRGIVYLDLINYRFTLKTSAGVTVWGPIDNIEAVPPSDPFAGNVHLLGTLDVDGLTTLVGDCNIGGNTGINANLDVTGTITGAGGESLAGNFQGGGTIKSTGQPGFLAYNSVDDAAQGNGATIDFDTEVYDETGDFAADTFTAPVTGRYLFAASVTINTFSAVPRQPGIELVTTGRTYQGSYIEAAVNTSHTLTIVVIAAMTAGDTA